VTDPAGGMSLAQEYLRTALADCSTFQAWVGAADQAEALARIYHEALPAPANGNEYTLAELQAYRPFALIWTSEQNGYSKRRLAVGTWAESGRIMIRLEEDVDPQIANDPAEVARRFRNTIGQIIDELCALTDPGAGYLVFHTVTVEAGPIRTEEDEARTLGDAQAVELSVEYGSAP